MTLILPFQSSLPRWEESHINTFNTRSENRKSHLTRSDKEVQASEKYFSWANQKAVKMTAFQLDLERQRKANQVYQPA